MGLGIFLRTRGRLETAAYEALQKLKHARSVDNLTDTYKYNDEMDAALDELNERGLYTDGR